MLFYLGTHMVNWIGETDVPLFLSAVRFRHCARQGQRNWPRSSGRWALDSGGFSEIQKHGRWTIEPERFADEVITWSALVGAPDFVAIQDWMCEPFMVAKTGLSITEHQRRTVASFERLLVLAPRVSWLPVIQGWGVSDYGRHLDMYHASGHELDKLPRVGIGSICRRQGTREAEDIVRSMVDRGLRVHAFGAKTDGIARYRGLLSSADSLAWSFSARKNNIRLPGCRHSRCTSCLRFALQWRSRLA